jgi:hypothetical protein
VGVFLLLQHIGLGADGSFLGGLLVGAVFYGACAVRLPGGRSSVNDLRFELLARITRRAGWDVPHEAGRPRAAEDRACATDGPRLP